MDINVRRFVDIDIKRHVSSTVSSIRDTVALFTSSGVLNTDKIFNNLAELNADSTYSKYTDVVEYATVFFNNGGLKLHVHCGIQDAAKIQVAVNSLPMKEVVVAYAGEFSELKSAIEAISANSNIYGAYQKLFLGRLTSPELISGMKNFAVKVSAVKGAEMTIAAYLSKIAIYGNNSARDYAFTSENIEAEANNDEVLGQVLNDNMNVDMILADAVRNLGGNLTDGTDIVNQYMMIVLQQTVTDRLINLLTEKIKGQTGASAIYTCIAAELGKYVTNGYLTVDKIWTDATKTVDYNGRTYSLIEQNTPLTLGYKIAMLPMSSLSDEDKKSHKCPPIYIFLAESYGIRSITIQGEAI